MLNSVNGGSAIYQSNNTALMEKKGGVLENSASKDVSKTNRADEIKRAIQSGEYKIDLDKTSEKMALNLLGV